MQRKPKRAQVAGERYERLLLRITDFDLDERPRGCTAVYDDDIVNLAHGSKEFMVVYAPAEMLKKRGR